MKTNTKSLSNSIQTFEGGKADKTSNYFNLRRTVLSTLLWENSFYENGESVVDRISNLIPKIQPDLVANLAIEARNQFNLRHVPLLIVVEMAKHNSHKHLISDTIYNIVNRPDELSELLSLYWKNGKCPISNQIKKGLAKAFTKFSEYSLAKYNQDNKIKLRDVLFLTHAKPIDDEQANLWKRLINNELKTPDTWEVALSASNGQNKKEIWENLLKENKLGSLALLKNLRNMKESNVDENLISFALENMDTSKVLPFRFISAARYYPNMETEIEKAMFKSVSKLPKLHGKTALLVDVSGSMDMSKISEKSELTRMDAACALAILVREQCENANIYTFSKVGKEIPNRRGFALRDAIINSQPHKDTYINQGIDLVNQKDYNRVIVLTDGQIADNMKPLNCNNNYMLNIANYKNGIGYKKGWTVIDGFSESVIDYLIAIESQNLNDF